MYSCLSTAGSRPSWQQTKYLSLGLRICFQSFHLGLRLSGVSYLGTSMIQLYVKTFLIYWLPTWGSYPSIFIRKSKHNNSTHKYNTPPTHQPTHSINILFLFLFHKYTLPHRISLHPYAIGSRSRLQPYCYIKTEKGNWWEAQQESDPRTCRVARVFRVGKPCFTLSTLHCHTATSWEAPALTFILSLFTGSDFHHTTFPISTITPTSRT